MRNGAVKGTLFLRIIVYAERRLEESRKERFT